MSVELPPNKRKMYPTRIQTIKTDHLDNPSKSIQSDIQIETANDNNNDDDNHTGITKNKNKNNKNKNKNKNELKRSSPFNTDQDKQDINNVDDHDFKFKRHRIKNSNDIPSLGERLDNLQDINRARRIDNFNSSIQVPPSSKADNRTNNTDHVNIPTDHASVSQLRHQQQLKKQVDNPFQASGSVSSDSSTGNDGMNIQNAAPGLGPTPYMPYMYYYPPPPPPAQLLPPNSNFSPKNYQSFPPSFPPPHPPFSVPNYLLSPVQNSQYLPNSSLQPFYPTSNQNMMMTSPMYPSSSSRIPSSSLQTQAPQHLLPPASLYPYDIAYQNYHQTNLTNQTRNKRKSLTQQRGKRLSILSQDNNNIISPHKDIPQDEFYKHIANISFGKNLQLKQLFNWCMIRSLEILQSKSKSISKSRARQNNTTANNNNNTDMITLNIIKNFVTDLRRGIIDIDWEPEPVENEDDNEQENADDDEEEEENEDEKEDLTNGFESYEDTELRQLFPDDTTTIRRKQEEAIMNKNRKQNQSNKKTMKKKTKNKVIRSAVTNDVDDDCYNNNNYNNNKKKKKLLPNSKNVQNLNNLNILNEKINKIKSEIDQWATSLDAVDPEFGWKYIKSIVNDNIDVDVENNRKEDELSIKTKSTQVEPAEMMSSLYEDLMTKLDALHMNSHYVNSHSTALDKISSQKLLKLSDHINESNMHKRYEDNNAKNGRVDMNKLLLRGLSESILNKKQFLQEQHRR
ncbi:MIND complex subunit DSN1 NDAI_0B01700 [Naumovozyma dairenensis CBS 421]|uniref:Uncharacterized protein n=1 Tax=Naumovozyma dairenensis (strain ATCC 10597 / BCRC 20456 / CBS 421 / NBRC 0211 / NRRL Y-12639) TaxID=1071378 RepID=G0W5Z3_NAUDC|nr:hypothetical protein NDAI_0B01700 [Naumovozyma dairenensis CBS 421]CCD23204.1 hypothetical protein NDAI_0B01700 [Naumovozyma dairenensis CBS 421]